MASTSQAALREQLGKTLITQVTGVTDEPGLGHFERLNGLVRRTLVKTRTSTSADMFQMDSKFKGLVEKAKVLVQDDLADALDLSYKRVKAVVNEREAMDPGIKMHTLPDHLQLLISLALQPSPATHTFASIVLERERDPLRVPSALTWQTILAEEPFEGRHWEGVLNGNARDPNLGRAPKRWTKRSYSSSSSVSSDSASEDRHYSRPSSRPTSALSCSPDLPDERGSESPHQMHTSDRVKLIELLARQYWNAGWQIDVDVNRPFDLTKPCTLGPSVLRALQSSDLAAQRLAQPGRETYIHEVDAVREVLLALQGMDNNLFEIDQRDVNPFGSVRVKSPTLVLVHLSSKTFHSILSSFASACTVCHRLSSFIAAVTGFPMPTSSGIQPMGRSVSSTLEAFAEAVNEALRRFQQWSSLKEQSLSRALYGDGEPLIVSLLSLLTEVEQAVSVLHVLCDIIMAVQPYLPVSPEPPRNDPTVAPIAMSVRLLDTTLAVYESHLNMGNMDLASALLQVFVAAAQPMWSMVASWLRTGHVRLSHGEPAADDFESEDLEDDFFIQQHPDVLMSDPSFWSSAHTIRVAVENVSVVPLFLSDVASNILAGGKAESLLSAIGQGDTEGSSDALTQTLSEVVFSGSTDFRAAQDPILQVSSREKPPCPTTKELALIIQDHILPPCAAAQNSLNRVLVEDCHLWQHLSAMEGLYFMHRGDVMSDFCDVLIDRMTTRQPWNDFHFLNAAFRDVIASGKDSWIDASLVRLWYRGPRERSGMRLTRSLEGLFVEYQIPIPLAYLFGSAATQSYSNLFVLILQLRRAKRLIDQILVRNGALDTFIITAKDGAAELKAFYALRSKLSWFINAFMYFVCTTVIHVQVQVFHKALKSARSLDEMIMLHSVHMERLSSRCLLQESTAVLHRAVLSILDIALHFSNCYAALSGEATVDMSRRSAGVLPGRRRRTRRQRRLARKQDYIGFVDAKPPATDSNSSDSDDVAELPDVSVVDESLSLGATISFVEESFVTRIDRMSSEMDGLVRFLRRGIEGLARGSGEASTSFEILSFALEDWDL